MRQLFNFRYPKITLLIVVGIIAYFIFSNSYVANYVSNLGSLSYLGIFIAGMLFTFGFTTPIAIGFFVTINPSNIFLSAVLGGLGALLSDLLIFKLIRFSFMDEFERLENTHPAKKLNALIRKEFGKKIRNYLLYVFSGIIIASPLPDEVGITMLAGLSHIKTSTLAIISFIFNTIGIFIMLNI